MSGLGKHQREILRALKGGAKLVKSGAIWRVKDEGLTWHVSHLSCATLYARGYVMYDEEKGSFVLTQKGRQG